MSDTLTKAVAALVKHEGHGRQQARRFLGRCTPDEVRAIAAAETTDLFEEAIEAVLDRLEMNDTRR